MIIMGIDPGTATTGWGVISVSRGKSKLQSVGIISTKAKTDLHKRLSVIADDIEELLTEYKPDVLVIEQLFFNTNAKTALSVGHARGVILLCGQRFGCQIVSYTPLQVKMAITGYGRADKKQVQEMVKTLLKLKSIPKPDDAADALAVALTHSFVVKT